MKSLLIAVATALTLTGCTLSPKLAGFLGTNDPCVAGAGLHAAFNTLVMTQPKLAKAAKAEAAFYAGFQKQCADGDVSKVTLAKSLDAYSAAIAEWRKQ